MDRHDDRVDERIAHEYLQPLFAFSRSRTANLVEAEELTGEILLQVYDSLRRGNEIRDFPRWIWSIAHYTYGRYLSRRKADAELIGGSPHFLPDKRTRGPEEELERKQLIARIRQRVAFLSETHHQIIILRYFRSKKIDEIAAILGIPAGTVKWHLHEIRNGLKQGEDPMSHRTNDQIETLACAPERLVVGHSGRLGEWIRPSRIVNDRLIVQNILLTTYPTPKSTQEIAAELGIPTPYIANEVKHLHRAELLARNDDDSYVTDFIIQNQSLVAEWYRIIEQHLQFFVDTTRDFFDTNKSRIAPVISPFADTSADYKRALWTLIPYAFDIEGILGIDEQPERLQRNDGGSWIVMARHLDPDRDSFYKKYDFTRMDGVMWGSDGANIPWVLETKWTGFQSHRRPLLHEKWSSVPAVPSMNHRAVY